MARNFVSLGPADLGINAVSAVAVTPTTGNLVRIRDLDAVIFVFQFSATPFTGRFNIVPQDKDGADLPALFIHDAAFVFATAQTFAFGPGNGTRFGGTVAAVLCGSIMGFESIKPQPQVTIAGTGTYSLHMFGTGR